MHPSRRDFLKTAGLATIGAAAAEPGTAASLRPRHRPERRPNILFILSDDHADRAMSCYGSVVNRTPNLDRIAQGGMRFDRACVTMSLCAPSRASILTGTYPHVNGQVIIGRLFDGTQPTFPQILQAAGYQTALVGKWHLETEPTGFDYWNIILGQGVYFDPPMVENGVYHENSGYITDIITDRCIEWLDARDDSRPFLLCCHHKAPHWICEPHPRHEHNYDGVDFPVPETFDDTTPRSYDPEIDWTIDDLHLRYQGEYKHPRWSNLPEGLSPTERKKDNYNRFMRDYLATIDAMDEGIGRILDRLEADGLADNTIVIYASDNGYYMGEHGWIDKKTPYEESLRIPLVVRYPGVTAPGSTSGDCVLNIDLAPTILDLAGLDPHPAMQGRSFRFVLEGHTPRDWRKTFYFQYYTIRDFAHCGIRTPRYKLIHFYTLDAWELYDLERDPHDLRNVYGDPDYANITPILKRELGVFRKQYGIDEKLELELYEESLSGAWGKEVRAYMDGKMKEWRK